MTGKEGLIRGRLMSKYLDYSGRSVITVNPSLNMDEAGLPVDIAAKLYQPFVIRELYLSNKAHTRPEAIKKSADINDPDTWAALEKVVQERPVILNRAPSLHQFSLQAFKPKLTKSRAIELNPLIVTGFNADFDGDQMGVHVPLTSDAINEANTLLLPSNNMINPTNGSLIAVVKGEAILGLYYLTMD
jgi:DNA-directed RNA polymerase subunit beta'